MRDHDFLEQMDESRAELLRVSVLLAHRLRNVSPGEAQVAAGEVAYIRRGLRESSLLEPGVTSSVLRLVEDALLKDHH